MSKKSAHREQQRILARRKNFARRWKKRSLWLAPLLVMIVWLAYAILTAPSLTAWPYGTVHWHTRFDISVCGETRSLEHLGGPNNHFGGPVVHTHGDNQMHVEGNPGSLEKASIGSFFKTVGVPYSDNGIFEYTKGEPCEGSVSSSMRVFVNDVLIQNASSYVPKDNDLVKIVYE